MRNQKDILIILFLVVFLGMGLGMNLACTEGDDDDDTFFLDDDDGSDNVCGIDYDASPGCSASDEACGNAMMINQDREDHPDESDCAPAIKWHEAIAAVALAHSRDMCEQGFFDHVNPDGLDPFERMKEGGVTDFVTAGENIAFGLNVSIQDLEDAFMDEPECVLNHRGIILDRDFTHVGVGVYHCPQNDRIYLTQNFATFDFDDIRDDPHEYCD